MLSAGVHHMVSHERYESLACIILKRILCEACMSHSSIISPSLDTQPPHQITLSVDEKKLLVDFDKCDFKLIHAHLIAERDVSTMQFVMFVCCW